MAEVRTPDQLRDILAEIDGDDGMSLGMHAMLERAGEMGTPLAAKLVGIGMHAPSRIHLNNRLDGWWATSAAFENARRQTTTIEEIVVGSGLHAAIYCSIRHRMGAPKPLVIEANERAGGAFAYSLEPSFYLNSRNRPGKLGTPGRDEALNFIPGGIFQPVDLDCDEYQTNAALAYTIRCSLAMFAKVVTNKRVEGWEVNYSGNVNVRFNRGPDLECRRLIVATGLGDPIRVSGEGIENKGGLMTYPKFLARFDKPFPLRGMKKVAVIGAGDSGKTAVEALLGQGPGQGMSPGSMDFPEKIDWYGMNESEFTREGFQSCNRSRYQGIARALPRQGRGGTDNARITPIRRRPEAYELTYNGVLVDGARYDAVITCAGYEVRQPTRRSVNDAYAYTVDNRVVGKKIERGEIYFVGPCAQIPEEVRANIPRDVPENAVAVFRYADRTAALAMAFPVDQFRLLSSAQKDRFFADIGVTRDLSPVAI